MRQASTISVRRARRSGQGVCASAPYVRSMAIGWWWPACGGIPAGPAPAQLDIADAGCPVAQSVSLMQSSRLASPQPTPPARPERARGTAPGSQGRRRNGRSLWRSWTVRHGGTYVENLSRTGPVAAPLRRADGRSRDLRSHTRASRSGSGRVGTASSSAPAWTTRSAWLRRIDPGRSACVRSVTWLLMM